MGRTIPVLLLLFACPVFAAQFGSLLPDGTYEVFIDGALEKTLLAEDGMIEVDLPDGMHVIQLKPLEVEPTPTPTPVILADLILTDLPDIRVPANINGQSPRAVLDLNDYVTHPFEWDSDGYRVPLTWAEDNVLGDDNTSVAANELQVSIPARSAPSRGQVTFSVADSVGGTDYVGPVEVKTVDVLLGGPLVDGFLAAGETPSSSVPYSWCLDGGTQIMIPFDQSSSVGGQIFLNVSSGIGQTSFLGEDTLLSAEEQSDPLGPFNQPVTLLGTSTGTWETSSLDAGGLSVEANLDGMSVQAQPGFSGWRRVTVTHVSAMGGSDCYTLAIGKILTGTDQNLSGNLEDGFDGGITVTEAEAVYGFEGMTVEQLLGASSVFAYESDPASARSSQSTSWNLTALGQKGDDLSGGALPEIDITEAGKPAATFPGASSSKALKLTFDREDQQGVFMSHRGIAPTEYNPGDVVTLSMNLYVDLNYEAGTESADEINEASNGLNIIMAVTAEPFGTSGVFNYISVPPTEALIDIQNEVERDCGVNLGHHAGTNISAILHGKWTRHQVSYRVPEIGQLVEGGPGGSGDLVDPNGLSPKILIGRSDTGLANHIQTVWIDNITVSNCPSPLSFAHGAINCPMISAGWSIQYSDGASGSVIGENDTDTLPPALARGAIINGNFSTASQGITPIPSGAQKFFRIAENASAGWTDDRDSTDVAFIGQGELDTALEFPAGFNQSLVLTPDPSAVGGVGLETPSRDASIPSSGHAGMVGVQSPFLDMRLASTALTPGLRVNDVQFAAGTGTSGLSENRIQGNISGVFGIRWFARTNGLTPADNPQLNVVFANADYTNGLASQQPPQTLPNGADTLCEGTVWVENQMSGTIVSFSSNRNYDFFTRQQSASNPTTRSAALVENPGAQLAQISIVRSNPGAHESVLLVGGHGIGLRGYEDYLGEYPFESPPQHVIDAVPGRYCTATVFVDEVNLYAVRDTPEMYDEDLCWRSTLPPA